MTKATELLALSARVANFVLEANEGDLSYYFPSIMHSCSLQTATAS